MSATLLRASNQLVQNSSSSESPVNVVYIAGTVRSGSTLLGRLLGIADNAIHVGEIKELWLALKHGFLCECKEPVAKCPFWQEVIANATDPNLPIDLDELIQTTRMLDSIRSATANLILAKTNPSSERIIRLKKQMGLVYKSVAAVSGCSTIIDSSKSPIFGKLASTIPGIHVSSIHLIRDSRAVTFSLQRRRIDPAKPGRVFMPRRNSIYSSVSWAAVHSMIDSDPISANQVRVRYEDLATDSDTTLASMMPILSSKNVRSAPLLSPLSFLPGHSIAGNPGKFQRDVVIVSDDEWQSHLPFASRALVTAITLPLLLRYGYELSA